MRSIISRDDGSTTEIRQLLTQSEITTAGLDTIVGADAKRWIENASKPHGGQASGWLRVLSIDRKPRTLGDGIAAPTLKAAPVMAIFTTTQSDLFAFQLDGELICSAPLEMTKTHPVWCETRNDWILAGELNPGDRIATANGPATVRSITLSQKGATVYNLSVAVGSTFFVGDDRAWVHNCGFIDNLGSGVVDKAHHNWQRMFGRKPTLAEVRPILMDVAENGVPMFSRPQSNGWTVEFESVVNGHRVWARVFTDGKSMWLSNGGVR